MLEGVRRGDRLAWPWCPPLGGEEGDGGACYLLQLEHIAGAQSGVCLGGEGAALVASSAAIEAVAASGRASHSGGSHRFEVASAVFAVQEE